MITPPHRHRLTEAWCLYGVYPRFRSNRSQKGSIEPKLQHALFIGAKSKITTSNRNYFRALLANKSRQQAQRYCNVSTTHRHTM